MEIKIHRGTKELLEIFKKRWLSFFGRIKLKKGEDFFKNCDYEDLVIILYLGFSEKVFLDFAFKGKVRLKLEQIKIRESEKENLLKFIRIVKDLKSE